MQDLSPEIKLEVRTGTLVEDSLPCLTHAGSGLRTNVILLWHDGALCIRIEEVGEASMRHSKWHLAQLLLSACPNLQPLGPSHSPMSCPNSVATLLASSHSGGGLGPAQTGQAAAVPSLTSRLDLCPLSLWPGTSVWLVAFNAVGWCRRRTATAREVKRARYYGLV
jgi:hypothetical protein